MLIYGFSNGDEDSNLDCSTDTKCGHQILVNKELTLVL